MDNLISTSFVIEYRNGYVDPTIYFTQPDSTEDTVVHMFYNPFDAKKFIRQAMGESVEILVRQKVS